MAEPAFDQRVVELVSPACRATLVVDDGECGGQQRRVCFVQHDEHVRVGLVEVARRLGRVVEAEDGRRGAPSQYRPAGREPGVERGEAEGPATLRRRKRVDAKACLGNDAERAFTPDEELGQVGTRGGAGTVPFGADDSAVSQDDLEAEHHVLDLSVARRVLAGAATGEPPANGGEIH